MSPLHDGSESVDDPAIIRYLYGVMRAQEPCEPYEIDFWRAYVSADGCEQPAEAVRARWTSHILPHLVDGRRYVGLLEREVLEALSPLVSREVRRVHERDGLIEASVLVSEQDEQQQVLCCVCQVEDVSMNERNFRCPQCKQPACCLKCYTQVLTQGDKRCPICYSSWFPVPVCVEPAPVGYRRLMPLIVSSTDHLIVTESEVRHMIVNAPLINAPIDSGRPLHVVPGRAIKFAGALYLVVQ